MIIIFYKTIGDTTEHIFGNVDDDNEGYSKKILNYQEEEYFQKFPLLAISPNGELEFDFSSIEEEKKKQLEEANIFLSKIL